MKPREWLPWEAGAYIQASALGWGCLFYTAWLYKSDLSHWMMQLLSPQGLFSKRTHGRAPVCLTCSNCIQPTASQFMVGNSLRNKKLHLYFLPHCEKFNFTWISFLSLLAWLQKPELFHFRNNIYQQIIAKQLSKKRPGYREELNCTTSKAGSWAFRSVFDTICHRFWSWLSQCSCGFIAETTRLCEIRLVHLAHKFF